MLLVQCISRDDRISYLRMEKNYITPSGFKRLQDELRQLRQIERPEIVKTVEWAASNGDRSENGDYLYGKKRLREIDRRLRFLSKQIENAEVVDPLAVKGDIVRFGATVALAFEDGSEKTFSIVGMDESDVALGRISWKSPLASALMKRKAGDAVTFHSPKGEQEVEILEVRYEEIVERA